MIILRNLYILLGAEVTYRLLCYTRLFLTALFEFMPDRGLTRYPLMAPLPVSATR